MDGAEGNQAAKIEIRYQAFINSSNYDPATNTLYVTLSKSAGIATIADLINAINRGFDFIATGNSVINAKALYPNQGTITGLSGGRDSSSADILISAKDTSFIESTIKRGGFAICREFVCVNLIYSKIPESL